MPGPLNWTPISTPTLARMTGFPARWFSPSTAVHCVALGVIVLWGAVPTLAPGTRKRPRLVQQFDNVTPLPELVSAGNEGESGTQRRSPKVDNPTDNHTGVQTYYGVQHIVSTPPDPDNSFQTVLQPDLLSPPKLPQPVPLPNMVKLAMPRSLVLPSLPQTKVTQAAPPAPVLPSAQNSPPVDLASTEQTALLSKSPVPPPPVPIKVTPKLPVAPSASPALETVIAKFQPPAAPAAPSRQVETAAATSGPTSPDIPHPGTGSDDRNLLVINSVNPADSTAHADPPPGELHGAFEVVPTLLPPSSSSSPGTSTSSSPSSGKAGGPSSTTAATGGSGTGKSSGADKNSQGGGGPSNSSTGQGTASAAVTSGAGSGQKGLAAGAGGSTGSQSGPFPNVTVEARKETPASPSASASHEPLKTPLHHEGYGMTIISGGSSGGGLRDFGVFRDGGATYTIYLDVTSIGVRGSRWSLQYGVSQEVRQAHLNRPLDLPLAPPYATKEILPLFPAALVAANIGRMMVVQAQLTAEGKLEGLHVLQSPDPKLSVLLEECLMKWAFQAASYGEEPVPIKVLLGIPIAAAMAQASGTP